MASQHQISGAENGIMASAIAKSKWRENENQ